MSADPETADLLLVNANVLTMDPDPLARPRARSVAIAGGRILAVDPDRAGVRAREVVDLAGATVLPGFHDAHNHMAWFGLTLTEADLRPAVAGTLGELYAAVTRQADATPAGDWVIGSGYDQNKLGAHPDRDGLDRAAPGRRVWLRHTSGHMCVVSSTVLADLGLTDRAVDVSGGKVVTDAAGRPTGLLQERAQELVAGLVHPYPVAVLADAIERAGARYLSEGITSVTEAGIGGGWIGHTPVELAAYQAAREGGRFHVRVELMIVSDALHPLAAHPGDGLELGLDLGIRTGFGDDWLRIGAMKIFTDGSLVGRTAAMHDDFAGLPGDRGYLQADPAELAATILAAHRSGWQVAAHAVGDRAIDLVLDAYAEAQRRHPRADTRHRIEHFAVSRPDQVQRAAQLGVIAVPQGRFATELGDGMLAAVGPERHGWLYRLRSLLAEGLTLPGSSDRPVAAGAPLLGVHDMVNRRAASGTPFNPGEAITAEQALRAYTSGSAYASHAENTRGTIAPGQLADLVVLSEDPTAVSPASIAGISVLATLVDGEPRFDVTGGQLLPRPGRGVGQPGQAGPAGWAPDTVGLGLAAWRATASAPVELARREPCDPFDRTRARRAGAGGRVPGGYPAAVAAAGGPGAGPRGRPR
jgi:predicted amidohydrolase YtcJ